MWLETRFQQVSTEEGDGKSEDSTVLLASADSLGLLINEFQRILALPQDKAHRVNYPAELISEMPPFRHIKILSNPPKELEELDEEADLPLPLWWTWGIPIGVVTILVLSTLGLVQVIDLLFDWMARLFVG